MMKRRRVMVRASVIVIVTTTVARGAIVVGAGFEMSNRLGENHRQRPSRQTRSFPDCHSHR